MANIGDLLDGDVTLEVQCIDRMYLNGWIPSLSHRGGLRWFLNEHLGKPIASPALLGQIRRRLVERLQQYAEQQRVPIVRFKSGERKDEGAKEMRRQRAVRDDMVFTGVAQDKAMATRRYFLTPYRWKVAWLFSRLEARVFRPAIAAFGDEPSVLPRPLRAPLKKLDAELDQLVSAAFPLGKAA